MNRTEQAKGRLESAPRPETVTVLMPVYNGETYLVKQVESILEQDYTSLSLIALDDCSSDDSLEILNTFAQRDPRVTVKVSDRNRGLISTLEVLLAEVESPYFALADQDDVWDPDKLSTSIRTLKDSGANLVYSDVRIIDESGQVLADAYLSSRRITPVNGSDPVPFIFRNPAIGHTIVSTSEVARRAIPFPPGLLFHESWLVAVACSAGSVRFIDRELGSYRQHGANVIGAKRRAHLPLTLQSVRRVPVRRRQATRAAALRAAARLHPELERVAQAYTARGFSRLLGVRTLGTLLASRRQILGWRSVVTEMGMFLVAPPERNSRTSRPYAED